MKHELKILPEYFHPVTTGEKTFEVRVNDRGFQRGDIVRLNEWDETPVDLWDGPVFSRTEPRGYTARFLEFRIGYVLPIRGNMVVFSLLPLEETS